MSDKYKFDDPNGMYFVTLTIVGWVDLFTKPELKRIVLESLKYCQDQKGLLIHGWCLMPSHLHMINSSLEKPLVGINHQGFQEVHRLCNDQRNQRGA